MADKTIQELPSATSVQLNDPFVLEQNGAAMNLSGQTLVTDLAAALDGHGGIANVTYTPPVAPSLNGTLTLTMADGTTNSVTITNGNGIASIAIAYGISSQGTTPGYVTQWYSVPTAPTDANPYQWTRIRMTDKTNQVTDAYTVSMKAINPTMSIGSVNAQTGANADATVTNSGTSYNPVFNFDFTLPKGDKGDTGDYIDPVVLFGVSDSAQTVPSTWYSSFPTNQMAGGVYVWQKTDYNLHDAGTTQSTDVKIIGYIGQNGTGSGSVTQITFNGTVYNEDGTGNVTMNITPADVDAIADPANKSNGQVLTWDNTAGEWVATTPSTGNVNTVNNVGVTAGTTNIAITGANIPVSASDSRTINNAIPVASSTTPAALGTAAVGTGTTWARADHVHAMPTISQVSAASPTPLVDLIYPVGSIYMSTNSVSPETFLGGEWDPIQGRFLLGVGANEENTTDYWGSTAYNQVNCPAGEMGGEAWHTLTWNEMPSHTHNITRYTSGGSSTGNALNTAVNVKRTNDAAYGALAAGGGQHHNNMPPYLAVYMWERTA